MIELTSNEQLCLAALRAEQEGLDHDGWGVVYLDNAKPDSMPPRTWRAVLSSLSKKGLYEPQDGWAFGRVKMD